MKYLLELYNNGQPKKQIYPMGKEDFTIIKTLRAHGLIRNDAVSVEGDRLNTSHIEYFATVYPLTPEGEDYLNLGWYIILMKSSAYNIARDIAGFVGGVVSVGYVLFNILK